jgi:two-component system, OmpR family, osmolarity sensor histidine kinase EnvZ
MALPQRFDSLFARLVLLQSVLALALATLFVVVFYAERNITVSRLLADRWAPALHPSGVPLPLDMAPAATPQREATGPAFSLPGLLLGPRNIALKAALLERGVAVDRVVLALNGDGLEVWLQLSPSQGAIWYRLPGQELLPNMPLRVGLGLLLGLAGVVTASWWFTRRLVQPLRDMEAAMQGLQPGALQSEVLPAALDAQAPPELRAIDARWRELLTRYREHEAERAMLLAGVSHDLRSPLARIRLAADLLPKEPGTAARAESIVRNVLLADRLIESFLDHVRAGELPLDQHCDLAEIARLVVLRQERPTTELMLHAPDPVGLHKANPQLIERLLANLIENGLRHGRPPVEVRVQALDQRAVLRVSDAGPGLDAEVFAQLLQAFARGDSARNAPGSGLGLAIVARTVARMGGQLRAEREGGRFAVVVEWPTDP